MGARTKKKIRYTPSYSNSTTTEALNNYHFGSAYISVKGISAADIALRDAPETQRRTVKVDAQPTVARSLERSLIENANIWSELAKH